MTDEIQAPIAVNSENSAIPNPVNPVNPALAAQIDTLQAGHEANESMLQSALERIEKLEAFVVPILETGVAGPEAATAGGLVQGIVNFLHHHFPGQAGLPGVASMTVAGNATGLDPRAASRVGG